MIVHKSSELNKLEGAILTIGMFDGVHLGHKLLIEMLINQAKYKHKNSVILTLWPPPSVVFAPEKPYESILTLDEKIELLAQTGVQHLIVFPFSKEIAKLTSQEFIENILCRKIGISELLLGFNHHFGSDRQKDIATLAKYAQNCGITVERAGQVTVNETVISSSKIRQLLKAGETEQAAEFLGYDYFITGIVVEGNHIAATIGFPTANVQVNDPDKIIPSPGVYAVFVKIGNQFYKGMLNIGFKPTFFQNISKPVIEVHILDFNQDIYNHSITLYFKKKIRNEIKFSAANELVVQINEDKNNIIEYLDQTTIKFFNF